MSNTAAVRGKPASATNKPQKQNAVVSVDGKRGIDLLHDPTINKAGGKAVYAGGVQFPPVHLGGQTFLPSQANNLYIFPAVGMAVYATQSERVTDEMFIEAAQAVADQVTPEQLKLGMLFPPQSNILETEIKTAARVAQLVFEDGLAGVARPEDCEAFIRSHVYKPEYRNLV